MFSYLVKRGVHIMITAFLAFTLIFVVIRLVGDPARLMLPVTAPQSAYEELQSQLGLDRPIWEQYSMFLKSAAKGDAGDSFWRREPSLPLVLQRLPVTLTLASIATLFTLVLGISLGVLAAWTRGSRLDSLITMFSALSVGVPEFWVALLLVIFVASNVSWIPTSGYKLSLAYLILPISVLALPKIGRLINMTRANMIEILHEQYIVVARAKGVAGKAILFKHALRNAIIPVLTLAGFDLARWVAGETLVVEAVFQIPGAGLLLIDALNRFDMPVVEASILVFTLATSLIFLLVDVAYHFVDPRIRYD